MPIRKSVRILLLLLLSLLGQAALAASTVYGQVTSSLAPSVPVAGCLVEFSHPSNSAKVLVSAVTDSQGNYSARLQAGNYQVRFLAKGFSPMELHAHKFQDGATQQLNVSEIPAITGMEIPQKNEKLETSYSITNPHPFSVPYNWLLRRAGLVGSGVAPPGVSTLQTNAPYHCEHLHIFVSGHSVQPLRVVKLAPPTNVNIVTGEVTDSDGNPLADVLVTLTKASDGTTETDYTDSNGTYNFYDESTGKYQLSYSLDNYQPATQVYKVTEVGGTAPLISLMPVPPPPTATVSVDVSDPNGPIVGAAVSISYSNGKNFSGYTDGTGNCQFTQQPVNVAGQISASAQDGTGRTATVSTSGFVAGTNEVAVVLGAPPSERLVGTVTDNTGAPVSNVTVDLLDSNGNVLLTTATQSDGTYAFAAVSYGSYSLVFTAPTYVSSTATVLIPPTLGTTTVNVSIIPYALTVSTVNVNVMDNGVPAVGDLVSIAYADGSSSITLTTDVNGNASFTGQAANLSAIVTAVAQDGTGRAVNSNSLVFTGGGSTSVNLELPFENNAQLSGSVIDSSTGMSIPGAVVSVTPSASGALSGTQTTGTLGQYSLSPLSDGLYTVTVQAPGYNSYTGTVIASSNSQLNVTLVPTFASVTVQVSAADGSLVTNVTVAIKFANGASDMASGSGSSVTLTGEPIGVPGVVTVSLPDGRSTSQTFTFVPGPNPISLTVAAPTGSISGFVVDSTTYFVLPGVSVTLLDANANSISTQTDGHGLFTFANLPLGNYTVSFSATGYASTSQVVTVADGVTTTLSQPLTPLGYVSGYVTFMPRGLGNGVAQPQGPTTLTVTDNTGATVATATVNAVSSGGTFVAPYSFQLAPGSYLITATTPGFYDGTASVGIVANQGQQVNVQEQTPLVNVNVFDPYGKPIPYAQVGFVSSSYTSGGTQNGTGTTLALSTGGALGGLISASVQVNGIQYSQTVQYNATNPVSDQSVTIVIPTPVTFTITVEGYLNGKLSLETANVTIFLNDGSSQEAATVKGKVTFTVPYGTSGLISFYGTGTYAHNFGPTEQYFGPLQSVSNSVVVNDVGGGA